jgi:hypothetical protein
VQQPGQVILLKPSPARAPPLPKPFQDSQSSQDKPRFPAWHLGPWKTSPLLYLISLLPSTDSPVGLNFMRFLESAMLNPTSTSLLAAPHPNTFPLLPLFSFLNTQPRPHLHLDCPLFSYTAPLCSYIQNVSLSQSIVPGNWYFQRALAMSIHLCTPGAYSRRQKINE